jgi:hypothetical protein
MYYIQEDKDYIIFTAEKLKLAKYNRSKSFTKGKVR